MSLALFEYLRQKDLKNPKSQKNQNTKIPKIKQILEITKYLKDQNIIREPKISNILNIFFKI